MVFGAAIAFLFIFGLFLSMLGSSPKSSAEMECSSDTDSVQDLLHTEILQAANSTESLLPAA
jgi:hypothetical protein